MRLLLLASWIGMIFFLMSCSAPNVSSITKTEFGQMPDGQPVDLFKLSNKNGVEVSITTYGGIITSIIVPDKNGKMGDIALGYDTLSAYLDGSPYFGSIIGRYGNRIAKGKFTLNGNEYNLAVNNGLNHLHGGDMGFDKILWQASPINDPDSPALELTYTSPDGEEGYPGNLACKVIYKLTGENALEIAYEATTDKPTIVNLTNHTYFNLKDGGKSSILEHSLMMKADKYVPVDSTLIPEGEILSVEGTPMDFRVPIAIGAGINADDEQIRRGGGYDHCWVFSEQGDISKLAARVSEPTTGRILEVYTTEPGVQFYSGNFLNGSFTGKGGVSYAHRSAFCLETQHYPDSPNQPQFPSVTLNPGEKYTSKTIYKFVSKP